MNIKLLLIQLTVLVVLILCNAFFAASEVALISLKPSQIRRLSKRKRGKIVQKLHSDTGRFLATVQVGVTLSGFLASAFAAESFARPITQILYDNGWCFVASENLESIITILITVVLSYFSLIFGELVPKQLGIRYAEKVSLFAAIPIELTARLTKPFVWLLTASVAGIMKLFNLNSTREEYVTEEDIINMIDIGKEHGVLKKKEHEMLYNIFAFNDKTAGEIMTPLKDMVAIDINAPEEQLEAYLLLANHSRIPVYEKEIDNVTGILYLREYFRQKLNHEKIELKETVKKALYAPVNVKVDKLFDEFQKHKVSIAIIINSSGKTAGIVTLSDILEAIVGSLEDEFDREKGDRKPLKFEIWRSNRIRKSGAFVKSRK